MEATILKFVDYGQWVLLLGVIVWLIKSTLAMVSENAKTMSDVVVKNTTAITGLNSTVSRIADSAEDHETNAVADRKVLDRIDGTSERIEETINDTNQRIRKLGEQ